MFYPTWRVFTDDPTFGDEDCGLQEEMRGHRRGSLRNPRLRPRSIPRGSKPTRRHQPASQRHKRRFQDIESRESIKRFSKERQVGWTKKLKETAANSQKTRKQGIK